MEKNYMIAGIIGIVFIIILTLVVVGIKYADNAGTFAAGGYFGQAQIAQPINDSLQFEDTGVATREGVTNEEVVATETGSTTTQAIDEDILAKGLANSSKTILDKCYTVTKNQYDEKTGVINFTTQPKPFEEFAAISYMHDRDNGYSDKSLVTEVKAKNGDFDIDGVSQVSVYRGTFAFGNQSNAYLERVQPDIYAPEKTKTVRVGIFDICRAASGDNYSGCKTMSGKVGVSGNVYVAKEQIGKEVCVKSEIK